MADSQSKIDIAAEKAFADAAAKKAAEAVASAPKAEVAPAVIADKPAASAPAKAVAKPAPAKKAAKKVAAAKTTRKPVAPKARPAPKARKIAAKKPVVRAAAKPVSTTPIAQLKDKLMATTTTKTADFTAKAKETAADMQTRLKTAYDKGTEMTADMTAFHKGNFDAIVESGKVLAATMQDLGRTAVEDAKSAAETVTADVKKMAAIKSPTELFQLQGEIARRNLDMMVARTSKNAEVMMKLASEMFAPISTRASVAMERVTKAA